MPKTFDDKVLERYATEVWGYRAQLPKETIDEYREYVANIHHKIDPVEAHEVRTGRPWNEWTKADAIKVLEKSPESRRIPAILKVLLS